LFSVYLRKVLILMGFALVPLIAASGQNFPVDPAAKSLPDRLGEFRAAGAVESRKDELFDQTDRLRITSWASRSYVSKDGRRFSVILLTTPSDSAAYSELMKKRMSVQNARDGNTTSVAGTGTAAFSYWDGLRNDLSLFKGKVFASIRDDGKVRDLAALTDFSKTLADTLDKGDGEIPVLVKHLPEWQQLQNSVSYAVTLETLRSALNNQPVLDAINFDGGTEAVVGDYGGPRLAIVEFHTPQIASDNDGRIKAKIQELTGQGQPLPSAYRRVGNYSVFVFDAPSQEFANRLIDQVQYQPVVQWLGKNPYLYDEAANEFTRTTLGVFIAVVKASGLVIIGSLAFGGLLGALLFRQRRAKQRSVDTYSDAGGMVRLNLDEMTPRTDSARLLGPGN
jgi:hypothetical protein